MKFWLQHYSCEPLNMSKWVYIWLDNLLHKIHITGKMKVPLSTKICFLSWTKKLRLQRCFSKSSLFFYPASEFIFELTIYYIKLTLQVKWRYHYPPKFVSWVGQRNWDFSIVLASPVYFYPASEFIFEFTIYYIKLTSQVKWRYHYPPKWMCHYVGNLCFLS